MRRALIAILLIGVVGVGFSATLTYREVCAAAADGCSALGTPGTILGYPPCVYGLIMYLLILAIASFGLRAKS